MDKNVVIIGGSAAGITAGITARRHYEDANITLIRKEEKVLIPCGIPYIFGTVGSPPYFSIKSNNALWGMAPSR